MAAAEYKFYVKASPDGRSLGDCPFTQRANLALRLKGVKNVTLILIDLGSKPEWFKKMSNSVPVLERTDGTMTSSDSYEIVQYLDRTYRDPPLNLPGNKEAEEVTGQIFSIFSAWAKNSDPKTDKELEDKVTAELKKIDDFLGKNPGAFLCGDQWAVSDCVLVPRLFHITTVARHYKNYSKWEELPKLSHYMDVAFKTDEFKATGYPPEYVLAGWAKYFQ